MAKKVAAMLNGKQMGKRAERGIELGGDRGWAAEWGGWGAGECRREEEVGISLRFVEHKIFVPLQVGQSHGRNW